MGKILLFVTKDYPTDIQVHILSFVNKLSCK